MKSWEVQVRWKEGLHARPAARLVRLARTFTSRIQLRCNEQIANAQSILSVLLLCAAMGSTIQIEAHGDDEEQAVQAVREIFESPDK